MLKKNCVTSSKNFKKRKYIYQKLLSNCRIFINNATNYNKTIERICHKYIFLLL